ncbi:MAG: hypothetical protein ABSA65_19635 [Acidimicrobiales bacterium]|jgi:hypothetical protein
MLTVLVVVDHVLGQNLPEMVVAKDEDCVEPLWGTVPTSRSA